MRKLNSAIELLNEIIDLYLKDANKVLVIVIGGCSRTGKSTLANELSILLNKAGCASMILNIDSWLVSVEKRKPNSKVFERYDTETIGNSVLKLLRGEKIYPPVYDPVTRRSKNPEIGTPLQINSGILIIEGVISLYLKELVKIAALKIFVETSDMLRIKRLIEFYSIVKKVTRSEYKKIIKSRELEEVPFVKKTARHADIVFRY